MNPISAHFRALENMYLSAPINRLFRPRITVGHGTAEVEIDVNETLFHTAGAVHGAVYFKLLDEAAFFAANSVETEYFVLTTSFTTYITRPVCAGRMRARGTLVNSNKSQWIAEAVVYDEQDREIGRGNGVFMRSKVLLAATQGYAPIRAPRPALACTA